MVLDEWLASRRQHSKAPACALQQKLVLCPCIFRPAGALQWQSPQANKTGADCHDTARRAAGHARLRNPCLRGQRLDST